MTNKLTLYLSGPMTGKPNFNFPLFDEVAAALRRQEWDILNPAEHDRHMHPDIETWPGFATGIVSPKFDVRHALEWDYGSILRAHGIALLPGWEASKGARGERFIAEQVVKGILIVVPHREKRWDVNPDPLGAKRMLHPVLRGYHQ
jgi:hypothetical protein